MVATFEELLILIMTNPGQALLVIESLRIASELTKEKWKIISEKFKEKQKLREFGCTPSDRLADEIRKIDLTPKFQQLKNLIGKHRLLRLVRIGLYLEQLNQKGATELVDQIRNQIFENHGDDGLRILSMGSSGLMAEIIDSLQSLKDEFNLLPYDLVKRFEYIVKKIDYLTVLVNNEDAPANIELKILNKMNQYPQQFYVIATGIASDKTMQVIAKMSNDRKFVEKGYMIFNPKIQSYGEIKKQYLWIIARFL